MTQSTVVFLSGEAMHPSAIRDRWPGARFIARASISALPAELNPAFAEALPTVDGRATVWGIAITVPDNLSGERRQGSIDAGEAIEVTLEEAPLLAGAPEAVLSAALYWELDTGFTAKLRAAAGVAAPAAEGGWESPLLEAEPPAS